MIFSNANLVTFHGDSGYGIVSRGAVVAADGRIAWIGPASQLPARYNDLPNHDLEGRLVTPGLVDCHTHLIHAGNRAHEFEQRLQGSSYAEIASSGGGIQTTVAATREASEEELLVTALKRVDILMSEGVTTVEVKSGYGLDIDTELKMLRVARRIDQLRPIRVCTSFLGAHTPSPEYRDRADEYLERVCLPALEIAVVENLVDAVDGFCEAIAFTPGQVSSVFQRAQRLGLPIKLHADQMSDLGGARLAAQHGALSADHLEFASVAGVRAMAASGTVAVMLPGAFYTLRETQLPPIAEFRSHYVPMAVATDLNPGSSPLHSLLLAMNMACTLFRLTPEESLRGTTCHAAQALGLSDAGRLWVGYHADLAIWDAEHPAELSYRMGGTKLFARVFAGELTC
ncbi:imidazolonepropionase [Bremerella sp. JC770]|uniref:imidazolonepropionase n=1 Tax=Bremerella sp. JC770 TaxID=3232137 RepID=UPI00345B23C3